MWTSMFKSTTPEGLFSLLNERGVVIGKNNAGYDAMKLRLALPGLAAVALAGIASLFFAPSAEEAGRNTPAMREPAAVAAASMAPPEAIGKRDMDDAAALPRGTGFETLRHRTQKTVSDPAFTAAQKFDALWRDFERLDHDPAGAQYLLDTMRLLPLQPSAARASKIEAGLYGGIHAEPVKRSLVNLLASQYETDLTLSAAEQARLRANPQVAAMLARAARSPDAEIAHQAVMQYARAGLFPDSISILDAALASGTITRAEYTKELGFLLPLIQAPEAQQQALQAIRRAGVSDSAIAEDLAAMVLLPHALASIHGQTLRSLQDILAGAEPAFATPPAPMDFLDLVRYSDWISARAAIDATLSGGSKEDRVATLVMQENTDPRGLLAVLASPLAEQVSRALAQRGQTQAAQQRLSHLSLQTGNDAAAFRMIEEARIRISQSPR
ncbi:hypothetical protein ACKI2N_018975 [Cupriavidus sp. 30B13]|uniref:hypothetical protein n=1 Tax=Cupriavidus sp. 30B13 TaxID=3384241 RepID=UPI003B8F8B46